MERVEQHRAAACFRAETHQAPQIAEIPHAVVAFRAHPVELDRETPGAAFALDGGRLIAGGRGDDELHLAHGTGAVHAFDGQLVIARLQRERQRQGPAHKRLSVQIASLELFHFLGNEFAPVLAAGLPAQMPAIGLPVLAYGERDRDMAGAGSRSRFSFAQHLHRRQRLFPSAPLESEQGCSDLSFAVRRHVHGFE